MTTRRLKASSAALALSGVVALAGCGGGGDDRLTASTYKKQLRKIAKSFLMEVQREQRSFDAATTTSARTAVLVRFKGSFTNLADQVDAIKPPSTAQSTQDQLVAALRKSATDIAQFGSALKAKDSATTQSTMAALQADTEKVNWVISALQSKLGDQPPAAPTAPGTSSPP